MMGALARKSADEWRDKVPFPRSTYEGAGGWKDGRIGQAYDLLSAALADRGEAIFRHPLLAEIEALDGESA